MRAVRDAARRGFYCPQTRTFRPLCREALMYIAFGPIIGAMVAVALAVLP